MRLMSRIGIIIMFAGMLLAIVGVVLMLLGIIKDIW